MSKTVKKDYSWLKDAKTTHQVAVDTLREAKKALAKKEKKK